MGREGDSEGRETVKGIGRGKIGGEMGKRNRDIGCEGRERRDREGYTVKLKGK